MLTVKLDQENGIVILKPDGALTKNDFESAAKTIDPSIEESGKLDWHHNPCQVISGLGFICSTHHTS